jgi:hypothetical protein
MIRCNVYVPGRPGPISVTATGYSINAERILEFYDATKNAAAGSLGDVVAAFCNWDFFEVGR